MAVTLKCTLLTSTYINIPPGISARWFGANSLWLYPMDEKHRTATRRIERWGTVNSSDELLERVRQGWIGFIGDLTSRIYIRRSCDLLSVGERLSDWEYGMVLQRDSDLTPQFDKRLAR